MGTNYPHTTGSNGDISSHGETPGEGLGDRVIDRLRHLMCGLHGHDTLLQFEHSRMFLRCVSCGHETPGWELNDVPPTVTAQVEAPHLPSVARAQLIGERPVA